MNKITKFIMAAGLAVSFNSFATTVPYVDFNELVDSSEHVVGGVVKSIKLKKEKDGQLYTILQIHDAYTVTEDGEILHKRPVKIRMLGGEELIYDDKGKPVGARGLSMHGTPEFEEGQEVILFVSHNGDADMPIVGWQQGHFTVSKDDTIETGHGEPIVGVQNSDLVTLIDGEPTIKGKSAFKKSKKAKSNNGKKPEIVGFDGGQDHGRIVGAAHANEKALANSMAFENLSEYEFKSMVKERRILKPKFKNGGGKPDTAALFELPEIAVERASPKSARINEDGTFDSTPVPTLPESGPSDNLKLPAVSKTTARHLHDH